MMMMMTYCCSAAHLVTSGDIQGQRSSYGSIAASSDIKQQHCAGIQMMHQQHVVMDRQFHMPAEDFVAVLQHHCIPAIRDGKIYQHPVILVYVTLAVNWTGRGFSSRVGKYSIQRCMLVTFLT